MICILGYLPVQAAFAHKRLGGDSAFILQLFNRNNRQNNSLILNILIYFDSSFHIWPHH